MASYEMARIVEWENHPLGLKKKQLHCGEVTLQKLGEITTTQKHVSQKNMYICKGMYLRIFFLYFFLEELSA